MKSIRRALLTVALALMLIIGTLSGGSCCMHRASKSFTVPEDILSHSLSLTLHTESGKHSVGSGTYVVLNDKPCILTAAHVWSALVSMAVLSEDGIPLACHGNDCVTIGPEFTVHMDSSEDWAIIALPRVLEDSTPATLSTKISDIGDRVYLVGYPQGTELLLHGMVAGFTRIDPDPYTYYVIDGYACYGSSGGGMYTKDGKLVGIAIAIGTLRGNVLSRMLGAPVPIEDPNIVYVLPLRELEPFI